MILKLGIDSLKRGDLVQFQVGLSVGPETVERQTLRLNCCLSMTWREWVAAGHPLYIDVDTDDASWQRAD